MEPLFAGASSGVLRTLADAFRVGRLGAGASRLSLNRVCACPEGVATSISRLLGEGMAPRHMALLLEAHADTVDAQSSGESSVELVWTGPESPVSFSRDTSVVVRELFQSAQRSVVVSTFVIQAGKVVFDALAQRMEELPALRAQIFLHIGRNRRDSRHESELLREFADRFRKDWPGARRPEVFYDPRALAVNGDRSIWHAKCVLVDEEVAFVTSANFTEPAQTRNVEAGVITRDGRFVEQLRAQFDGLIASGQVKRLPGF